MTESNTIDHWEYHVAGVIVFLVWLELMMLVGRFPVFGIYIQMWTKGKVVIQKLLMNII